MQCVALLVVISAASCSRVNYCGSKICGHINAHTFCQYPEGPSPNCMGYIEAPITNDEKVRLIARLNRRRSEAARGRLRRLPPAGNMLKLRWVEELAREAQRWADQCRPVSTPEERDICRDLYSVSVGQCVASVVGEAPGLRVESMIDLWHMQAMLYRGNVTSYIPATNKAAYYGDFAQMLWAKTYMVGCGRSRFMAPWRGRLRSTERLVCNFAPRGPPAAHALWTPGPAAAACETRSLPDPLLTALCTYQPEFMNNYEVDNTMTIEEYVTLNTVLEIEANESLNFHGSMDEIFLTKMAMLAMSNVVIGTERNNYIQKRDVADIVLLEDAKADLYKIAYVTELHNVTLATLPSVKDKSRKRTKKISLIGRPKTYNMEDLNVIKYENVHKMIEEAPITEKDLYTDYEFKEVDDVTDTTSIEAKIPLVTGDNESNVKEMEIRTTTTVMSENDTLVVKRLKNAMLNNTLMYTNNETNVIDNIEDFLNDSETVRALQDALDRMERTLGPTPQGQGKVRRDLRDITEELESDENSNYKQTDSPPEVKSNKTNDRGPMMNMVLKYMPYLKHYEKEILGNGAGCATPGLLVLTLFFV
ncbi:hypothetical protein O3G_MSEX008227 [Manduca sexta]|uniref:SCP domain-containing protein n=2 Tax=Manduca sexta TaxID=7130 RepID=A0A922CNM3_MANSE|nr:hypothetical protein O3G_MSEX008227 [Manduca sexta]